MFYIPLVDTFCIPFSTFLQKSRCFFLTYLNKLTIHRDIFVTCYEIPVPNLPRAFNGFTIVQLTDIHYGFLIESISEVAKRNDMKVFKGNIRNQEAVNKEDLDKLVFFQFMIGNLDWSITERHNMKLIKGDKGALPIAIPYDFDYSGIVNTPYAVPPEELYLPDVKTRLFRGFCRLNNYQETIEFYKSIEDDLFTEVNSLATLRENGVNNVTRYLTGFFENLNSEKYINKKIIKACKVNHKHAFEYD